MKRIGRERQEQGKRLPATWRVWREGATTTWRFPVTWRFASTWERASMGVKVLENDGR